MGMFLVEAGTKGKLVHFSRFGSPDYEEYTFEETVVFDKSQLAIDPTGVSKHACGPHGVTIGNYFASRGWYGFDHIVDGGKILVIVPAPDVQYG